MNKSIKVIIAFLIGVISAGSIGEYATVKIQASEVGYNGTPLDEVLNDLYNRSNNRKAVCMLLDGTVNTVGAKYSCNPGDGTARNFYLLKVAGDNVKLIMEQNLSDTVGSPTMNHSTALAYFTSGAGVSIKNSWTNVMSIDLPDAQDIADAGNITGWNVVTATEDNWSYFGVNSQSDGNKKSNYAWLYNYTRGCVNYGACTIQYSNGDTNKANGYWTKDLISNNSTSAWIVNKYGSLTHDSTSVDTNCGVRPVITVPKSNLY